MRGQGVLCSAFCLLGLLCALPQTLSEGEVGAGGGQFSVEAALKLALDAFYKKEYGTAESILGQIIQGEPQSADAWNILAHTYN